MRTELMTEAMCWDLSSKVTANYAHTYPDFSYFCPHPICLRDVHAGQRTNTYFIAGDKHVPGCPNEAKEIESTGMASKPAKKESILPASAIPTELGSAKRPTGKKKKPTRDELLALANSLKTMPPYCAGNLQEVVNAWRQMSPEQRREKQLRINGIDLNYQSAFYSLGAFGERPMEKFPCAINIIYGRAQIVKYDTYFWITSVKRIHKDDGSKLNLVVRVPKDNAAAREIEELLTSDQGNIDYTIFYFGGIPTESLSGKNYMISENISDEYKRFIILPTLK